MKGISVWIRRIDFESDTGVTVGPRELYYAIPPLAASSWPVLNGFKALSSCSSEVNARDFNRA